MASSDAVLNLSIEFSLVSAVGHESDHGGAHDEEDHADAEKREPQRKKDHIAKGEADHPESSELPAENFFVAQS